MEESGSTNLKRITQDMLTFAIALVKEKYEPEDTNTYYKLAKLVSKEYGCICDTHDIQVYYSPTVEEEIEDLELIYKNCM